jgi:uncharacterized membrane protein YgaE (UPF0421/DUF939 family)
VARLAGTAVFAYLVALPGTHWLVLAPLTALLVAQVSLYQTLRSAVQRVAAVVARVLHAVGLSALVAGLRARLRPGRRHAHCRVDRR